LNQFGIIFVRIYLVKVKTNLEEKMKALFYISCISLLIFSGCSSNLYMGAEYDDLYYTPSDAQKVNSQSIVNEPISNNQGSSDLLYDNVYASDTLIADQYINASDYNNDVILYDNNDKSAFEYNEGLSYSGRLRNFYGNYFDPFWRDPWYYGGLGFGYGSSFGYGYPYYGYGSMNSMYSMYYNPYDYYYGGYYGGYYGSYYGGYYGSYYNSFYNPYYGYNSGRYSSSYIENSSLPVVRRDRYSTLSNTSSGSAVQKALSTVPNESIRRTATSSDNTVVETRRPSNGTTVSPATSVSPSSGSTDTGAATRRVVSTQTTNVTPAANSQPEYDASGRTYTPTYTNPVMSTRPVFNNTKTGTTSVSTNTPTQSNQRSTSTSTSTGNSVINSGATNSTVRSSSVSTRPSGSTSSSSSTYSVPSRTTTNGASRYSAPSSGSSGSFNSSGASRSSSSFSSGSSSSSSSSGSSGSSVSRSSSSSSGSRR
jgi:hypothetical protein